MNGLEFYKKVREQQDVIDDLSNAIELISDDAPTSPVIEILKTVMKEKKSELDYYLKADVKIEVKR